MGDGGAVGGRDAWGSANNAGAETAAGRESSWGIGDAGRGGW
jgi:hypothetical protein